MVSLQAHRILRLASLAAALVVAAAALIAPKQASAQSTTPPAECVGGNAAGFDCDNVDLLAIVPSWQLSTAVCEVLLTLDPADNPNLGDVVDPHHPLATPLTGSDMWGWTTTDNDGNLREFALQGLSDVVAFIEVTNPADPRFLACMTAPQPNFLWRDVKVYNDHVYVVGDFSPELVSIPHDHEGEDPDHEVIHGLQIFDLNNLLDLDPLVPVEIGLDTGDGKGYFIYDGFDEAHNIVIDEQTGFATAVASDTCGAEFHMMDLSANPKDPEFLGCFNSGRPGAVHDAQCTIYHGPDEEHQGKEICLAFMEDQFSIFDMTPAVNGTGDPIALSEPKVYPGFGYVHQGWFTDDHRYVGSNDELDELNATTAGTPHNTKTYMWDVEDLDNPKFIAEYEGPTGSIDHNMYFKGIYLHQANYTAGYRVLDASNIANGDMEQVAFFDTHPPDVDAAVFGGVWSGYFYFESGAIAVSQLDAGELFILQPNLPENPEPPTPEEEPRDFVPDSGRVHGSGYLHGMTSHDGDSDSDSDSESDSDFEKINFSFDAKVKKGELKGKLKLKDKELDIKIEAQEITSLLPGGGDCNGTPTSEEGGFVFYAKGEYNGLAAEFRVCGEDNGKHGKGKAGEQDPDRFYLQCISGCVYNTADRTLDDGIDGGNIHLHDPITGYDPMQGGSGMAGTSAAPDASDQMVVTLDPMLSDGPTMGQPMTLTATVETASGTLDGITLKLHSKNENSISSSVETISSLVDGAAVFTVSPLQGVTAYWVTAGDIESNRVTLTGGL